MSAKTKFRIAAKLQHLAAIRRYVQKRAKALGVGPAIVPDVVLAVDEAATNVIVHGYWGRPGELEIEMDREGQSLIIRLRDEAEPFDPTQVQPPDVSLPPEERALGGLGIYMIRQVMDRVSHRILPHGGNELTMVKEL